MINWTVVGKTKLTIPVAVDGQYITLRVYLCLQRDASEEARRVCDS